MKSKKENKVKIEKKAAKVKLPAAKTKSKIPEKKKVSGKKDKDSKGKVIKSVKPSKNVETKKGTKATKESKTKDKVKTDKPKKFFPEKATVNILPAGAIPPKAPTAKRSAWTKKPMENPHSTPAGPCINLRDVFDSYVAKKYKRLKDEQRKVVWQEVAMRMLSEPSSRLTEITDEILSKK